MQFCNEQIRTQPLFSPPCASATYGSAWMCRRKNSDLNICSAPPPGVARLFTVKIFQYGGRHRAIGTMWLTMWPVTWPTEANENTRVAHGTLSAITVGSSNLCGSPKFQATAPNIVADQNFSVVLNLVMGAAWCWIRDWPRIWSTVRNQIGPRPVQSWAWNALHLRTLVSPISKLIYVRRCHREIIVLSLMRPQRQLVCDERHLLGQSIWAIKEGFNNKHTRRLVIGSGMPHDVNHASIDTQTSNLDLSKVLVLQSLKNVRILHSISWFRASDPRKKHQ